MVTLSGNREVARPEGAPEPASIRHLVVPLDGTPLAERAIAPAASLARALNAEVTLVRAYGRGSSLPSGSTMMRGLLRVNGGDVHHASLYLARLQVELRSLGIRASSRVVQAQPVEAILEVAAHAPIDHLVVLATRGGMRSGERSFDGSVAAEVIRDGAVPVLVVNGATANPFDASHTGSLRLAVPADDLARNPALSDLVHSIARVFGAEVAVLRTPRSASNETSNETSPITQPDAEEAVERALGGLRRQGIALLVESNGRHAPRETLGAFADARHADLVTLSGRHTPPRPAEDADYVLNVLRQSHVPVLFVP